MNKGLIQKLLPHFIAIAVFLIIAVIYCRPVLQGQVLNQSDITQWKGMSKSLFDYKEQYGHFPLWTNSMFSGMPAYQIAMESRINVSPGILFNVLTLGLPKPISFFFLACISFYFLSQVLRVNPYVGVIGALAYAYCTYNIGAIEAGHETKVQSIALIPAFIGSLILVYEKKYLWGAALTALTSLLLIAMNHMQIVYYGIIIAFFMTIGYMIWWIKEKQIKHALIALGIVIVTGLIGVLSNAVTILTTLDASKTTIRGGTELPDKDQTKTGLSKEYALSYSMYKTEPFVMMVPDMYGASGQSILEKMEESKSADALQSMPQGVANNLQGIAQAYWGGIGPIAPNAPFYLGAIICFLALIGFFILDNKHKWWALSTMIVSFMMGWGMYFESFNTFLLHNLPGYNKFRVPSMTIVIPIFLLTMLAILTLQKIIAVTDKDEIWKKYKKGLLLTGSIFIVIFLIYTSADFVSQSDKLVMQQISSASKEIQEQFQGPAQQLLSAVKDDRRSLFMSSIFRSLLFIAAAALMLWLSVRKKLPAWIVLAVVGVLSFADLMSVDSKYLNTESYEDEMEYNQTNFTPSELDKQILGDTSFYRVLDRRQRPGTGGAMTSYFHRSVEGYHPAKLSIYQDLIEHQLSKPQSNHILNMLNVKYILYSGEQGQDAASINTQNLGPAWFVKAVRFEPAPQAVMNALSNFNPKDTAIVFAKDQQLVKAGPVDSAANIQLIRNYNDSIVYRSNSSASGFGVFSEVYYDLGWKAYIDGNEVPIIRTNYVLRGLSIPAGQHEIRFVFKPSSFYTGQTVAMVAGIIVWLLIIGAAIQTYRASKVRKS